MSNINRKKIKLAIISRRFPPDTMGGVGKVLHEIWKKASQVYDTTLIIGWKGDLENVPSAAHKMKICYGNNFIDYIRFYFFCRRILKKEKPDIALINVFEVPDKSVPSITLLHDLSYENNPYVVGKIKKFIARMRLGKADKIITVSNKTKKEVIRSGIGDEEIRVVYNGVDHDKFKPRDKASGKFIVSYPARIVRSKGQHIAIEAIKMLPEKMLNDLTLKIVGFVEDQRYLSELKDMAKGLPVEFEINVSEIERYYQDADLVIFPTLMQEGFGFTAIEAMACGKPVIYSDIEGLREATGNIGIKVTPGDPKELAQRIEKLYYDESLRETLSKKGMEYVKEHYDWGRAFDGYKEVFEEVLQKKA